MLGSRGLEFALKHLQVSYSQNDFAVHEVRGSIITIEILTVRILLLESWTEKGGFPSHAKKPPGSATEYEQIQCSNWFII